jgi:hypothetical protein
MSWNGISGFESPKHSNKLIFIKHVLLKEHELSHLSKGKRQGHNDLIFIHDSPACVYIYKTCKLYDTHHHVPMYAKYEGTWI